MLIAPHIASICCSIVRPLLIYFLAKEKDRLRSCSYFHIYLPCFDVAIKKGPSSP
uniref:Uncharacterized protein n=1 Tax=Siphoviridae sp. ctLkp13 TaxID=2826252 RepID=A0A8S5LSQ0_9CAUD|nr:MAG TPA: hypothetical protein [Siphoviridae sp. ctLkp13]